VGNYLGCPIDGSIIREISQNKFAYGEWKLWRRAALGSIARVLWKCSCPFRWKLVWAMGTIYTTVFQVSLFPLCRCCIKSEIRYPDFPIPAMDQ
jgi:hypothetical protein